LQHDIGMRMARDTAAAHQKKFSDDALSRTQVPHSIDTD